MFSARHIGPTPDQISTMLGVLSLGSLEELATAAMPPQIRMAGDLPLAPAVDETSHLAQMRDLAARNRPLRAMIGLGYNGTVTPAVLRRNVLENPAWYTAYTPYQPEISQGRLEVLLAFQTMIADLTGLPTAGASLLDEATAAAEAMALARRASTKGRVFLVDRQVLPQTLAVVRTRARGLGIEVVVGSDDLVAELQAHDAFAVLVQTPGVDGGVRSPAQLQAIANKAHENEALVIAAADLLALTLMEAPGEWGADVAVGSSQRFGVPLFYGGPHAAFISVRDGLERQLPGRLVGVSIDADGVTGYRLALQTREQHIRRERATSNICTAQVLLAVMAALYAAYHGPVGLAAIASQVHQQTRRLAAAVRSVGLEVAHGSFFDTITVQVPEADSVVARAHRAGIHLRRIDAHHVGVSVGEDATEDEIAAVAQAFSASLTTEGWGDLAGHARRSEFCTHPFFTSYHSETAMMRFLRRLADRDYALDLGMIPLGSCTMKLNAVAELEPISYPGFADLHPFAPIGDSGGYFDLIAGLEQMLVAITGYDRVSLQPNAGSQGEFAGLLAIRGYHEARGEPHRRICLIPSSAHGTNAASAVMVGMRVVVVKASEDGSVDLDDLRAKIDQHAPELAAIMVTYPSTHGVFETDITELCDLVHAAGGQVYVDGANLNALVGLAQPGRFGADVSHLNLHKTFAIPHGGGGPGVGPVAVREHLAPWLPNHPLVDVGPTTSLGPVSAAPFGSAGILAISYGYIAMMGPQGLRRATEVALLNANYVAARLRSRYPILYTGPGDLVAHECIVDLRPLSKASGVSVDDVAKRLIDYGFHAPTMSFPVAGTLMIEPTESEDLGELDRFCDAMIAIADEIAAVTAGTWPADDNPLRNAPHPLARVTAEHWPHPYSRELAGFPMGRHAGPVAGAQVGKYWPPVSRIDNTYGDRHLVCSCPPPEAYERGDDQHQDIDR